ncbi:MAG: hypothetical protein AAF975_08535, partial [Spirochaetota bacterium]
PSFAQTQNLAKREINQQKAKNLPLAPAAGSSDKTLVREIIIDAKNYAKSEDQYYHPRLQRRTISAPMLGERGEPKPPAN